MNVVKKLFFEKLLFGCLLTIGLQVSLLDAATFYVNNTGDTGPGTLRDAITMSNSALSGPNTIDFSLLGSGVQTITPVTDLPTIVNNAVIIDGYTAVGSSPNTNPINQPNNATLTIVIQGPGAGYNLPGPINGLRLGTGSDGSTIQGLCINNFAYLTQAAPSVYAAGSGIEIDSSDNTVSGCFIGVDPSGEVSLPCIFDILIVGDGNTFGGSANESRNLTNGSYFYEVAVFGSNATIEGNTIGLDRSGTTSLQDTSAVGVVVDANGCTIQGNVISGHSNQNVLIFFADESLIIQGNTIGPDITGTQAVSPNGIGVFLYDSLSTPVSLQIDSNQISANTYGIVVGENSFSNAQFIGVQITNNLIGVDATGALPLPNTLDGILLGFAENTYIAGNVISANERHGIRTGKARYTTITDNSIGSDISETIALGNGGDGIRLGTTGVGLQSFGDVIGGAKPGTGNFIAYNAGNGIKTFSFVEDETIIGNTIAYNGKAGIYISPYAGEIDVGMYNNMGNVRLVGDLASQGDTNLGPLGTSNLIVSNVEDGIKIYRASRNTLQTNIVGFNGGTGVTIENGSSNLVGGKTGATVSTGNPPVLGNVITENGDDGVKVEEESGSADDNAIIGNSIADNQRDGIKLKKKKH